MSYRFEHKKRTYWVKELAKKVEVYQLPQAKGPVAEFVLESDAKATEVKIKSLLDIQGQLDQELSKLNQKMSGKQ